MGGEEMNLQLKGETNQYPNLTVALKVQGTTTIDLDVFLPRDKEVFTRQEINQAIIERLEDEPVAIYPQVWEINYIHTPEGKKQKIEQ